MVTPNGIKRINVPIGNQKLVCQYTHIVNSRGLLFGDDPFDYASPVLMAQLILIFFVTRVTCLFLRPLRQTRIIAQIVAGIIIGPSFLRHYLEFMEKLFPPGGKFILKTFADFGFMVHLFVLGVQVDASLLKHTPRKALAIGISSFFFPFTLGGLAYSVIANFIEIDSEIKDGLPLIMAVGSMTSFIVTTSLLTDLNILNSELGRLATSISMITDACGWCVTTIINNVTRALSVTVYDRLFSSLVVMGYYGIVFFVLRPFVLRIVARTPKGEPMRDSDFLAIVSIVLAIGFFGEYIGQHAGFGTFMFGLSLPEGPPLGTILVQKLDTIASALLLPIFCTVSGLDTNVFLVIGKKSSVIVQMVIGFGYIAKFTATILPSLYFNLPFRDALSLALIMCCRGIIEMAIFSSWRDIRVVNKQSFTLLIINMVIVTGLATPIISYLYDPSKRYRANSARAILRSGDNIDLRILVCIHNEDNVAGLLNLLETSNPMRGSPISVFALQLTELVGRTSAVLAPHHQRNKMTSNSTHSERIVNAFKYLEQRNRGSILVQHFTATSPYASMHDDICTLALDKRTDIVIVPFHKIWTVNGKIEACFPQIRSVNQNVMNKAPCSIGVLVDRGHHKGSHPSVVTSGTSYRIAMLYLGGADDREALAYSKRMANHENVSLTVVLFNKVDIEITRNEIGKGIVYKEVTVNDGSGTTSVICELEDEFDLFVVGKHHEPKSPLTSGLIEWSEYPELGIIGDMLAAPEFRFSVLVVQQQPLVDGLMHSPKLPKLADNSTSI